MANADFILGTMKNIKREDECCCCFGKEDLFSLLEPYNFKDNVEIYSTMIAECFQIELSSYIEECNRSLYMICRSCVFRLRDANMFRSQIQIAYDRLQAECLARQKNGQGIISSEYSDDIETKEHVLKCDPSEYDNTECNMNVASGPSLSNENLLKPLKVVLDKNDNKAIKSTLNASAKKCSKKLKTTKDGLDAKSQPSKIFFCNICNKLCRNVRAMRKHKKIHNINSYESVDYSISHKKRFCCDCCNKSYSVKASLNRHMKMIHFMKIEKFVCDICKKYFRQKESLRNHIMFHMGLINIKCHICNRPLHSKDGLDRHIQLCHAIVLTCDHCKKSYGNKDALRKHMRAHLKQKDWTCNICGKTLGSDQVFKDHILSHSGVKSQKCEICEKTFLTKASLQIHKKSHFNTSKSTCTYCNKVFKNATLLYRHKKIHFDIKKFICDYCENRYKSKQSLTQHILLHMRVANYHCDLCGKFFVTKWHLLHHKKTSHSIDPLF